MKNDFNRESYFFIRAIQYALKKIKRIIKYNVRFDKSNNIEFVHNAAVAAIIKDEAPYILEWIEYHRIIGVTKFYLYDNDSNDNLAEVLRPYIDQGIVSLEHLSGKKQQLHAYASAVKIAKDESKWLAILDLDEFINIGRDLSINDFLKKFDGKNVSEILLGWKIFGSNHQKSKTEGLVMERFTRRGPKNTIIAYKPILKPNKVLDFLNPHYAFVLGKVVDGDGKRMRYYPVKEDKYIPLSLMENANIHHYYTKSYDEFVSKSRRGFADGVESKRAARGKQDFDFYNRNDILDDELLKYVPEVKKRLTRLPIISL